MPEMYQLPIKHDKVVLTYEQDEEVRDMALKEGITYRLARHEYLESQCDR